VHGVKRILEIKFARKSTAGSSSWCRLVLRTQSRNCTPLHTTPLHSNLCMVPSVRIGVWPELCAVAHSCAPNTVPVLVGDRLLLRATTYLEPGMQITVNLLGHEVCGSH
jgi:hypothetical protein